MFLDPEATRALRLQVREAPGSQAGQCALLSAVRELCEQGRNSWRTTASRRGAVCGVTDELSESRSDGVSEQRFSGHSRSGLTRKEAKMASFFLPKNLFCKETLGNACIKWLPVLYYEGSSRNGLYSPLGIETLRIE